MDGESIIIRDLSKNKNLGSSCGETRYKAEQDCPGIWVGGTVQEVTTDGSSVRSLGALGLCLGSHVSSSVLDVRNDIVILSQSNLTLVVFSLYFFNHPF